MNLPLALRQDTCFGPSISSLQIPLNQVLTMIHLHSVFSPLLVSFWLQKVKVIALNIFWRMVQWELTRCEDVELLLSPACGKIIIHRLCHLQPFLDFWVCQSNLSQAFIAFILHLQPSQHGRHCFSSPAFVASNLLKNRKYKYSHMWQLPVIGFLVLYWYVFELSSKILVIYFTYTNGLIRMHGLISRIWTLWLKISRSEPRTAPSDTFEAQNEGLLEL